MSELKNIRIAQSHDTEENWRTVTDFVPSCGEFIIYDSDESFPLTRYKIGDGQTKLIDLPMFTVVPIDGNTVSLDGGRVKK